MTSAHKLLVASATLVAASSATAAVETLSGVGVTANWSDATNWTGSTNPTPQNGDSLVFGANVTGQTTLNNDISGLSVTGITFNAVGAAYTLGGNAITLASGGITDNFVGTETFNLATTLGASQSVTTAASAILTMGGAISDGGNAFGLTKAGAGTLTLSGANTYTGATTVSGGTLILSGTNTTASIAVGSSTLSLKAANALASGTAVTVTTGTLVLANNQTSAANVIFNGASRGNFAVGQNANWTGSITINASSTNGLTFNPGASSTISGNIANNSAGAFTVRNDNGAYAAALGVTTTAGSTTAFSGIISGVGGFQVGVGSAASKANLTGVNTFTGNITIQNSGSELIIGSAGSLGSGNYGGNISMVTSGATFTYNSSATQTLSGIISGTGGKLTKDNSGTLTLSGTNTYTGTTTVSNGTLLVNGSTAAGSAVIVNGGTLGGTGTINGTVNVTGVLAPGNSIESLATGSVTLNNLSTLAIEIQNATTADLLDITGSFNLIGTVTLDLTKLGIA
ncbi:MAG TPA: autotransporter-associated beta strand repeat-containing protein, partial [Luteolibacter sp.]